VIPMFVKKQFDSALNAFDTIIYKTREIIRPGRKVPRPKTTKRPYSMNYKPI
jgi:hypothetical protein